MAVAKPPITKTLLTPLSVIIHIAGSVIRTPIIYVSFDVVIAVVDIVVTVTYTLVGSTYKQYSV